MIRLPEDASGEVAFVVDETMLAGFGGVVIHPVLGTATLVHYLEWAGRKVIEPHLGRGEEGIGHAIDVVHRAPAPPGTTVTASATLTRHEGNRVVCRVEARSADGTLLADGEFTQVILPREAVRRRLGDTAAR